MSTGIVGIYISNASMIKDNTITGDKLQQWTPRVISQYQGQAGYGVIPPDGNGNEGRGWNQNLQNPTLLNPDDNNKLIEGWDVQVTGDVTISNDEADDSFGFAMYQLSNPLGKHLRIQMTDDVANSITLTGSPIGFAGPPPNQFQNVIYGLSGLVFQAGSVGDTSPNYTMTLTPRNISGSATTTPYTIPVSPYATQQILADLGTWNTIKFEIVIQATGIGEGDIDLHIGNFFLLMQPIIAKFNPAANENAAWIS